MKIFNLRFHLEQKTPTPGVTEINTYTVPDAQVRLDGRLTGLTFFIKIEGKTFEVTQCEDEHIIFYVPPNAESPEDFILCFQHNPYDGLFNDLHTYLCARNASILSNLWLFSLDYRFVYNQLPLTSILS